MAVNQSFSRIIEIKPERSKVETSPVYLFLILNNIENIKIHNTFRLDPYLCVRYFITLAEQVSAS